MKSKRKSGRPSETAGPGGGYILSSSNTIHPEVEAENYIAMVKATHEYGVYGTHDLS